MVAPHRLPCETPEAYKPSDLAAHTTRWVLPATILGSSMTFIDGSVVNVALPVMQRSLMTSFGALPVGRQRLHVDACQLDPVRRFGRRPLWAPSHLVIGLGTGPGLACLRTGAIRIVAGRRPYRSGRGRRLLTPTSLAIVGSAFSGEARGVAVGTWAAAGAHDSARASARRLAAGYDWLALDLLHQSADRRGSLLFALKLPADRGINRSEPLDRDGAVLAVLSLGLLSYGLIAREGAARRRRSLVARSRRSGYSFDARHAIADDAAVAVPRPQLQRGERPRSCSTPR